MAGNDRLVHPISTGELERRWRAVRSAMDEQGLDALIMQNNNEFLGGYVKWFTDSPARNAYYQTVLFPRDGGMTVVRQGPMGGVREVPADDFANRGIERLLTNPSYTSVHYARHYDAEQVLETLKRRGKNKWCYIRSNRTFRRIRYKSAFRRGTLRAGFSPAGP